MQVKVSESFPQMPVVVEAVGPVRKKCISSLCTASLYRIPTSNRVFSAIILWKPIPTPSMTASKQAHAIAEFEPPSSLLALPAHPVKNPAMTVAGSRSADILQPGLSTVGSVRTIM
jgi:hypothetical protein